MAGLTVRANASKAIQKLNGLQAALSYAPREAVSTFAEVQIRNTTEMTRARLGGFLEVNQVGFDLDEFIEQLRYFEVESDSDTGMARIFKLNPDEAVDEIELIRGVEGFWHMGTRRQGAFDRFILARADAREDLASGRRDIWRGNPQWVLLEYGSWGGLDAPTPPQRFLADSQLSRSSFHGFLAESIRRYAPGFVINYAGIIDV